MQRANSFNIDAETYDKSRPSYPKPVIDWIIEKTKPSKNYPLLEIGAGTGQATIPFLERGYQVLSIEPGENLAKLLKRKTKDYQINIKISKFEDWDSKGFMTDMIFCATAFHWLDPNIRYQKAYHLLTDKGNLVLLWNMAVDLKLPQVQEAYRMLWEYYPQNKSNNNDSDIHNERVSDIQNSGYFHLTHHLNYPWILNNTRDELLNGFFSQSSYLSLEEKDRNILKAKVTDLFSTLNDIIETEFLTVAYIAEKI